MVSVCVAVAEYLDKTSHFINTLKTGVCLWQNFVLYPLIVLVVS